MPPTIGPGIVAITAANFGQNESRIAKTDYLKSGFAYSLSKNFVVWYAQKCAFEYGLKGIRVVSLSPGLIATDMDIF